MTFQIYAHIAYTLIMVVGGGYLGYKYGVKAYSKLEATKSVVNKL